MTSRIKNKEEAFLILKYQRERGALPVGSYEVMKKKKAIYMRANSAPGQNLAPPPKGA